MRLEGHITKKGILAAYICLLTCLLIIMPSAQSLALMKSAQNFLLLSEVSRNKIIIMHIIFCISQLQKAASRGIAYIPQQYL